MEVHFKSNHRKRQFYLAPVLIDTVPAKRSLLRRGRRWQEANGSRHDPAECSLHFRALASWYENRPRNSMVSPHRSSSANSSSRHENSRMQTCGTGSGGKLRATQTASNQASGVNADDSSRGCARSGMGFNATVQVYREPPICLRRGAVSSLPRRRCKRFGVTRD